MSTARQRFPDLGKLSVAILEHWVAKLTGTGGVEQAKAPYIQKQVQDSLREALASTEQRFIHRIQNQDISNVVLSLPVTNHPSFQSAIWEFYQRPTSSTFAQLLWSELKRASEGRFSGQELETAVNTFIDILQEELVASVPSTRQALNTLANVRAEKTLKRLLEVLERLENDKFPPTNVSASQYIDEFTTLIYERSKRSGVI